MNSPTPWRIGTNGHVYDANGVQVAILDHGSGKHSVKGANGRLIVAAVNAHEERKTDVVPQPNHESSNLCNP